MRFLSNFVHVTKFPSVPKKQTNHDKMKILGVAGHYIAPSDTVLIGHTWNT